MEGKLDRELLLRAMRARGVESISTLAAKAGVHRNSLRPYLAGTKSVYSKTILAVCEELEISPNALIADHSISDPHDVLPIVEELLRLSVRDNPQLCFFLFGSRAQGSAKRFSDYDIGASAGSKPLAAVPFLDMKEALSELADDLPVKLDLVNFDQAPVWFLANLDSPLRFLNGSRQSFDMLKGRINGIKETLKSERVA